MTTERVHERPCPYWDAVGDLPPFGEAGCTCPVNEEPPGPAPRAYPGNADLRHCKWYLSSEDGGPKQVEVHLWSLAESTEDSRLGEGWAFRKCVVCGKPDEAFLQRQYEHMKLLEGPPGAEEPEGA